MQLHSDDLPAPVHSHDLTTMFRSDDYSHSVVSVDMRGL